MNRSEILQKFRQQVADGKPIVGGGAGTGISAKSAEAGGIDLLIIYNSGRFRMAGRGSLAGLMSYGDANAIVMEMAMEAKFRLFIPKRRHGMSGITNSMKAIRPRLFHRRTPALDVKLFIRK